MRILIIGGTSFIGPYVVRALQEKGHDITVFHRGKTSSNLLGDVRHIYGERDELEQQMKEITKVNPTVVLDMIPYFEKHAQMVMNVFQGLVERVVVISSVDVYRAYEILNRMKAGSIQRVPLKETDELRSVLFPYRGKLQKDFAHDYEKILVEQTVLNNTELSATILRLPMVYGPNDPQRRLLEYVQRMKDERPYILLDERMADWRTSMGYVENVASAIAMAVDNKEAASHIINIGESIALSLLEQVEEIGEVMNWKGQVISVPKGTMQDELPFDTRQDLVIDTTKLREQFNYEEPISRKEGLTRTVRWELANLPKNSPFDYDKEDAVFRRLNL